MTANRAALLAALEAAQPELVEIRVEGLSSPVYMRRLTMADSRTLPRADDAADLPIARQNALTLVRVLRDEDGELLFDAKDEAQVAELEGYLEQLDTRTYGRLIDAYRNLETPTAAEADDAGN